MADCPRGHDKTVVGVDLNNRCAECRREDHRAYKRTEAAKAREREVWAQSQTRRSKHGWTDMRRRLRQRIHDTRAAIARLEQEIANA